jgi:hypothetical protein
MGLAADRGVTICFADLDGADGLWVPEERTILVNRALSEQRVNEVIEHELAHVAIDDQHAALDAGVSRPPPSPVQSFLAKRWATPALSAAGFLALVAGVTAGLTAAVPDSSTQEISRTPEVSGTAAPTVSAGPTTSLSPSIGPDGQTYYKTVIVTPTRPGTPLPSPTDSAATLQSRVSTRPPAGGGPGTVGPGGTTPPLQPSATTDPPTPDPTTSEPSPSPTTTSPSPSAPVDGSIPAGDASDRATEGATVEATGTDLPGRGR